jgi:hypothetical protein
MFNFMFNFLMKFFNEMCDVYNTIYINIICENKIDYIIYK